MTHWPCFLLKQHTKYKTQTDNERWEHGIPNRTPSFLSNYQFDRTAGPNRQLVGIGRVRLIRKFADKAETKKNKKNVQGNADTQRVRTARKCTLTHEITLNVTTMKSVVKWDISKRIAKISYFGGRGGWESDLFIPKTRRKKKLKQPPKSDNHMGKCWRMYWVSLPLRKRWWLKPTIAYRESALFSTTLCDRLVHFFLVNLRDLFVFSSAERLVLRRVIFEIWI